MLSPKDGREKLIQGLRDRAAGKADRAFLELYRHFYSGQACRDQVKWLVEAAFYSFEERGIGRAAAKALYGSILQGSVTRLEQFASCAYAHFLKYGLELLERQEYELEAVDMGNLFHESIDRCFGVMKERGQDWRRTDRGRPQGPGEGMCGPGDSRLRQYHHVKLCQKWISGRQGGAHDRQDHLGSGGAGEEGRL